MISTKTQVPAFSLFNDVNETVTEKDLLSKWSIIYFYPRDETPECTLQACSLRDNLPEFTQRGVQIYGVSKDSVKSHVKFKARYSLTFPLLADTDHVMAEAFGIWVEKSMFGKKYSGMDRSTFVINPKGLVVGAYAKVDPIAHGPFLLEQIDKLMHA
jgi:peroxiredoxin Q/BCP